MEKKYKKTGFNKNYPPKLSNFQPVFLVFNQKSDFFTISSIVYNLILEIWVW